MYQQLARVDREGSLKGIWRYRGIPQLIEEPGQISCVLRLGGFCCAHDSVWFLSEEDRKGLMALARVASSPCRVTRRANALVLLDAGWSCQQVANAFLLDDDTVRGWSRLFEQRGIEGLKPRWYRGGLSAP